MNKARLSTLGLIFITVLSAIQYIFLRNVPDTVSTFSFLCVTNLLGLVILGVAQFPKVIHTPKRTLVKGILMAAELTGAAAELTGETVSLEEIVTDPYYDNTYWETWLWHGILRVTDIV